MIDILYFFQTKKQIQGNKLPNVMGNFPNQTAGFIGNLWHMVSYPDEWPTSRESHDFSSTVVA